MRIEAKMNRFEKRLFKMGDLTSNAMKEALKAFIEDDKNLAYKVVENDIVINNLEEQLNDKAIETLTLLQPVAKDLRLLIGGIKVANELERIADYAKNISIFVKNSEGLAPKYKTEILELTKIFLKNFNEVLNLLASRDIEEAYRIAKLDKILDDKFNVFIETLAKSKFEKTLLAVQLTNIAHNIERAGDHAKNVCEQIIYIENGEYIDFG